MNINFKRLTHAIALFEQHGFISKERSLYEGKLSSKELLINSFNNGSTEIRSNITFAELMLKTLEEHDHTEFTKKCLNAVLHDIPNSEGYIAVIPEIYSKLVRRNNLLSKITKPNEFLEDIRIFEGTVTVLMQDKWNKAYVVGDTGHLLTFYEKKRKLPIGDNMFIKGTVQKYILAQDPWETRLRNVKYV